MPVVENWVVSITTQSSSSMAARGQGDEPWWAVPGNHQRGCAEEKSLGRFVPMPACRPGVVSASPLGP